VFSSDNNFYSEFSHADLNCQRTQIILADNWPCHRGWST